VVPDTDGEVARLGGDEFVVAVRAAGAEVAEQWATRVLAVFEQPFSLRDLPIRIDASLGIATAPGDRSPSRPDLLSEFSDALDRKQLALHFQPKLSLDSGAVPGVEALVRWQHPKHGLLPPGAFLPLVEVSDLIGPLTHRVIDAAAAQARAWDDAGGPMAIAVNLSARDVVDGTLPDRIRTIMNRHAVPAERLEFEITETAMVVDMDRALSVLDRIGRLSAGIAIDDFGTGYSSLAFVRRLPHLSSLKIDRSFVTDMCSNAVDAVVVESMVSLAAGLGVRAIAEGVEGKPTMDALRRTGCHQAQGYYIARPMHAAAAESWFRQRCDGALALSAVGH
jgi:EAL domain-containing protein (putative c-di-GMP-specific phosphodiesterase class I)